MCAIGRIKFVCRNCTDGKGDEMRGKREIDNLAGSVSCAERFTTNGGLGRSETKTMEVLKGRILRQVERAELTSVLYSC